MIQKGFTDIAKHVPQLQILSIKNTILAVYEKEMSFVETKDVFYWDAEHLNGPNVLLFMYVTRSHKQTMSRSPEIFNLSLKIHYCGVSNAG